MTLSSQGKQVSLSYVLTLIEGCEQHVKAKGQLWKCHTCYRNLSGATLSWSLSVSTPVSLSRSLFWLQVPSRAICLTLNQCFVFLTFVLNQDCCLIIIIVIVIVKIRINYLYNALHIVDI